MRSENILDAPDEPEFDISKNKKLNWLRAIGMLLLVIGITMIIQHWPGGIFLALAGVVLIGLRDAIQLLTGAVKGFTAWAYFFGRICLFAYLIFPRIIDLEMGRWLLLPACIAFGAGIVYSTFLQKKE